MRSSQFNFCVFVFFIIGVSNASICETSGHPNAHLHHHDVVQLYCLLAGTTQLTVKSEAKVDTAAFLQFLLHMGGAHEHRDNIHLQNATARSVMETLQEETKQNNKITLESFAQTFFSWQKSTEHGPDDVQQVHLAMMDKPTQMRVTFATVGGALPSTGARVTLSTGEVFPASAYTYHVPPRWWQPDGWVGWLYTAVLSGLDPGRRYSYVVTTDRGRPSSNFSFIAPPSAQTETVAFATYGDMGTAMPLGFAVFDRLKTEHQRRPLDFVFHQGDIAYAGVDTSVPDLNITKTDELEYIWDLFMRQIEPVAATTPYMVGNGNHEAWYNWSAFAARFTMPKSSRGNCSSNGNFWFSFDYGPVHVTSASSEHPYHPGSPQHDWLSADLEAADANREAVPWVVFTAHRPLYCSDSDSYDNHSPGAPMLAAFEPLLLRYHVDLTLTGHQHGYERVHPVRNGSVLATPGVDGVYHNPPAPVHLMIGSAGALQEEKWVQPAPAWSAFRMADAFPEVTDSYGFGRVTITGGNRLDFEFVPVTGNRTDVFSIVRT